MKNSVIANAAKAGAKSLLSGILSRMPEHKRFDTACVLSRVLILLPHTVAIGISGPWTQSRILRALLDLSSQRGWTFTPRVRITGIELVQRYYAHAGRLILCSGHDIRLNCVLSRILSDGGYPMTLVSREPHVKVWGNGEQIPTISSSNQTWVRVRSALQQGRMIVLVGDSQIPQALRGSHEAPNYLKCPYGRSLYFSLIPLAVARLTQTPVLLFASRLGRGRTIEVIIEGPVTLDQGEEGLRRAAETCIQFIAQFREQD